MTSKEATEQLKNYHYENGTVPQEIILAIRALEFSEFVGKMLFDNWEQDCNGVFPELSCRQLVELGIVELRDGVYSLKRGG